MPTYTYRREDGSVFEIEQRISEPALEVCPDTGQKVKRLIRGGAGLVFKGDGFYLTDYARKGNGAASETAKKEPSKESASDKTETKASDSGSQSDTKAPAKSD